MFTARKACAVEQLIQPVLSQSFASKQQLAVLLSPSVKVQTCVLRANMNIPECTL
jgi:hypothetical protein